MVFIHKILPLLLTKSNFSKIIAVEPNPILVDRIKDNLSLLHNNIPEIANKVIIENYAIGLEKKEIYLDLSEGYGNARVKDSKNSRSYKNKYDKSTRASSKE